MTPTMRGPVCLFLSPSPAHVRTARLVAVAAAREWGVPEDRLEEVRLAVGEACARAVNAHSQGEIEKSVEVECAVHGDPQEFVVVIRDYAESASRAAGLNGTSPYAIGDFATPFVEDTLGVELAVAGQLAGSMHVKPLGGGGTEVHMRWQIYA